MKRVKPGRAPSAMSAMGSVFAAVFGVGWTILAVNMGAPWFFGLFGVFFIVMAVVQAVYHFKNATGKERYSAFDVVDDAEESDPADRWARREERGRETDFAKKEREVSADRESRDMDSELDGEAADAKVTGEEVADEEVNFCPYCGEKAERSFRFCRKCGKQIR